MRLLVCIALAACSGACVMMLDLKPLEVVDNSPPTDGGVRPGSDDGNVDPGDVDPDVEAATPCGDLSNDPLNCGHCAHRCPGVCAAGVCAPLVLATMGGTTAIALTTNDVLWTRLTAPTSGEIRTCAKQGCGQQPENIAATAAPSRFLYASEQHAAWVESSGAVSELHTCATGSCATTLAVFAPAYASAAALNGERVFWGSVSTREVYTCPVAGCATGIELAADASARNIVVSEDGGRLVFEESLSRSLQTQSVSDGTRTGAPVGVGLADMIRAGTDVVYALVSGGVFARALDLSGEPRALSTTDVTKNLAADAEHIYWTLSGAGVVVRCARDGCSSPEVVASGLAAVGPLAVDETFVYVATESAIVKLAKP